MGGIGELPFKESRDELVRDGRVQRKNFDSNLNKIFKFYGINPMDFYGILINRFKGDPVKQSEVSRRYLRADGSLKLSKSSFHCHRQGKPIPIWIAEIYARQLNEMCPVKIDVDAYKSEAGRLGIDMRAYELLVNKMNELRKRRVLYSDLIPKVYKLVDEIDTRKVK